MSSKPYTIEVAVGGGPGETKARRSPYCRNGELEDPANPSLLALFKQGVDLNPKGNCLGTRQLVDGKAGDYAWQSYEQVYERVLNFASGLLQAGQSKGSIIGIVSVNRAEWVMTDLACSVHSMLSCPLYDTLGPEALIHIVGQTEMSIVVGSADKMSMLYSQVDKLPSLKTLVCMDNDVPASMREAVAKANLQLFTFAEIEKMGAENRQEPSPSSGEDLFTIMYTSGTTGLPKGAMLTHRNIVSTVAGIHLLGSAGAFFTLDKDDVHLSYLPLAHIFERVVVAYALSRGCAVGFYQGDTAKLMDDIGALRPTIFPSVPRLLNRVYDKVIANIENAGGLKLMLFNAAVASKTANLKNGQLTHWLWDRLVFNKVKARLGGRVRGIVTGSAPIAPQVVDFLRLAFICEVFEAYGQTEGTAAATTTVVGDYDSGSVGGPFPMTECKLVDVPDMNYLSTDNPPRGEVCFRGPSIFKGYFKDPEKTAETLDADGWLHSGDIGTWDEKGRLRLIDRKKNIFKLAQGEYIAPEKIENVYQKNKYVAQAYVHGDSLKAYLVAVIVPDEETLRPWCESNGITGATLADLIKDPKVKEHILKSMIATGKELGLKGFEQARDIHLEAEAFSVENNLLTPSFKLKRADAKKRYTEALEALMAKIDAAEEAKKKAASD